MANGKGKGNNGNLVPFDERSESEQREIRSKGGKASGVARRQRKAIKETVEMILVLPVMDRKEWNALAKMGLDPEEITQQAALAMAIIQNAKKRGSPGDLETLAKLLGEGVAKAQQETEDDPITTALKEEGLADADER